MDEIVCEMIHRGLAVAILSDGTELKIINWMDEDHDECDRTTAIQCIAESIKGNKSKKYIIDLSRFRPVDIH